MSGASEREGTVQICVNDVWGTVCDSSWGSPEAKVVCKQLGLIYFSELVFLYLNQLRTFNVHFCYLTQ